MDDKVVIDCIGPSVLTITISGAAHSVSIATNVIRISGPGGSFEHNLDSLPLIYDAAALGGRLNICDRAGKMVYCWRSSVTPQPRPPASIPGRAVRSSSSQLGPVPRTEMTESDSSLVASSSSNQPSERGSTSVRTGDTSHLSTASFTATLTPSSNFISHDTTDSRKNDSDDTLDEASHQLEGPSNENPVVRFGRYLRELKEKRDWANLRELTLCQKCGDEPYDPVITNCDHVFCKECLIPLLKEAAEQDKDEVACPKCKDIIADVQSCESLKELWLDTFRKTGRRVGRRIGCKTEEGYINLEEEDTDQTASGFTDVQRGFLVNSINKLLELSYSPNSGFFRIMRSKLHAGLYPSIEALKVDFDRMENSFATENGSHQPRTEQARILWVAFERYMTNYPGQDEGSAPRKKARTVTPPARMPARAGACSSPRAAKTAMQGQKYPRDHW